LAAGALAASKPVRLARGTKPPTAMRAWTATVIAARGKRPKTLDASAGISRLSARFARSGPRRFRARMTLPFAGRWRLKARAGSRRYALGAVRAAPPAPVESALPGATATRICGGAGPPYPQYALAVDDQGLWVACRGAGTVERIDAGTGQVNGVLRLGGSAPYSIAAGAGAVWSVDRSTALTRVDETTGKRRASTLESDSAYLWWAAGNVWVAEDGTSTLARVDPATRRVTARIPTGNGTSSLVTDGVSAWITNHREATLDRIDLASNSVGRLAHLPGDAPERMVALAGSLWVTGRGTDLLRVDPVTGALQATIDVGAGAIDLAAARGSIWVFAPSTDDDQRGVPFVERMLRVDPATNVIVETVRPTARVVLDGVVSDGDTIWLADTAGGRLYRFGGT
jgi:streptogramin lyase